MFKNRLKKFLKDGARKYILWHIKHMIKLYLTKTDVVRVQSEINQSMEQSKGLT